MNSSKIFLLLFVSLNFLSCGREKKRTVNSLDIYRSYNVHHKAVYFKVPPGLVSVFLDESKPGNIELKAILSDTKLLSFLIFSRNNNHLKECKYYFEINSRLDSLHFRDLAQINNGKEIVKVKVDKDKKEYKEIVVFVSNYEALYCISFKGSFSSQKVVNLVKPENLVAIKNLDRFKH